MKDYKALDDDLLNNITGGTETEDREKVIDATVRVLENPGVLLDAIKQFEYAIKNNECPMCHATLSEDGKATLEIFNNHLSQVHFNK